MNNNVNRNMLLSIIKTLMSVLVPLITYPYATRVLGAEYFGKVSYGQSIVNYFALIAALGISSYATREGGIYRAKKEKFDRFSSEIFSLNLLSTIIAYFVMLVWMIITPAIHEYRVLLFIQSISIVFTTLSVDWINIIFEDYLYITIRTIIIQVISLVLLFLLVKTPQDYLLYAGIQVCSNGIIAVANLNYRKRYCRLNLVFPSVRQHIKPIMILFSNSLAVSIYCNADITITGVVCGDSYTGIYAFASKIYAILKQIIASAYTVAVTRMTEYVHQNKKAEYQELLNEVINIIIFLSVPITIGVVLLADEIVLTLGGIEYIEASRPLQILVITIFFAVMGGAMAYCINMPLKKEKSNLFCTIVSAIENIVLDIVLIKAWGINGAAWATLISEVTVMSLLLISVRKQIKENVHIKFIISNLLKCIVASVPIGIFLYVFRNFSFLPIGILCMVVLVSVPLYFGINILLKNKIINAILKIFRQ